MVRMFLVTANVGSVFENLEKGLPTWLDEFISVIRSKDPEFVAIHFQETGGKDYQNGSNCVNIFFGQLSERMGQVGFRRAEGFVDSRSDLEDQFTALSSVYFVHESVHPHAVAIWDFQEKCFKDVPSTVKIHIGIELDHTSRKQKEKFPQHFYPNCKWSRKGFLKTRWRIDGVVMDFVNIHLFHDADNLIAAASFPSPFAQSRERTLNYTLSRLQNDSLEEIPIFIFGDFNFRVNTQGVMAELKNEFDDSSLIFGTKTFKCPDHELRFLHSVDWLKKYDFEVKQQAGLLEELDLNFHPSYPFEEDGDKAEKFLRTRIPAWCDRVLFTHQTKALISQESPVEYNILGSKTCMGDHKPVYLSFALAKSIHSLDCISSNSNGQSSTAGRLPFKKSPSEFLSIRSNNSSATNSTHGTCQSSNKKCKCLVSLFKCNLSFTKCKKVSISSDFVSINPSNRTNNSTNCNKKIHSYNNPPVSSEEESESPNQKLSRSCYCINNSSKPWRTKRMNECTSCTTSIQQEIQDSKVEPIITDKPQRQTDQSQMILPISFQVSDKGKDMMEVPVNIQNLNVVSSISDKTNNSTGKSCSNKTLESSKLPFGWTNCKSRKHNINANDNSSNNKTTTSQQSSTKGSLCAKCVIL